MSLMMIIYVLDIVITQGSNMINYTNPTYTSVETAFEDIDNTILYNETAQVWFRIRDYKNKLDLDKRYLHAYALQIEKVVNEKTGKYD